MDVTIDPLETGLRFRLRRVVRQIAAQHRHLKPIYAEVGEALEGGQRAEVAAAFARYREALDAHFELELQFFFPAIHGLRPKTAEELERLSREHERFQAELGRVGALLSGGELEVGQRVLTRFAAAFAAHERREEALVELLSADTAGAL